MLIIKVFIVPSWYPIETSQNSGVFFKEQALALKNASVEVCIGYPEIYSLKNFHFKNATNELKVVNEDGLLTYRYKGYNYLPKIKRAANVIYCKRLRKIFNKYVEKHGKPDVIHAHSVIRGGWAASELLSNLALDIPLIITEHSSTFARNLLSDYNLSLAKKGFNYADKIIAVSPSLKEELINYTDENKITVIPNLVNMDRFKPISDKILNHNVFTFFSVAFLEYNKGMDFLIKSFAKAFKGNKDVRLVIGGNGTQKEKLIKLTQDLDVYKQIVFLGELTRTEVVEQMQNCDSFVLASRYETFGVVYIEALASGKPIIATKCGGPEYIVNKNNGLLVNVDDLDDLSNKMMYMFENRNKFSEEEIIENCRIRFSATSVAEQIKGVYRQLL